MKKTIYIILTLLFIRMGAKAIVYPIVIGTNYQSLYNLCLGDTLSFRGDSLNINAYGAVQGYVYNNQTHTYDNFNILSFTHIATTYDHVLTVGDSSYFYGNMQPQGFLNGRLNFNCLTTSVKSVDSKTIFSVYPNPTNSVINITDELNQFQNATVEIKNYLGQVVHTSPFTNQINIVHLSAGMYFLSFEYNDRKKIIKFIKE